MRDQNRAVEKRSTGVAGHCGPLSTPLDLDRVMLAASSVLSESGKEKRGEVSHLSNAIERMVFVLAPRWPERATRTELLVLLEAMRSRCRRLTKELERVKATPMPRQRVLPKGGVGAGVQRRGISLGGGEIDQVTLKRAP